MGTWDSIVFFGWGRGSEKMAAGRLNDMSTGIFPYSYRPAGNGRNALGKIFEKWIQYLYRRVTTLLSTYKRHALTHHIYFGQQHYREQKQAVYERTMRFTISITVQGTNSKFIYNFYKEWHASLSCLHSERKCMEIFFQVINFNSHKNLFNFFPSLSIEHNYRGENML